MKKIFFCVLVFLTLFSRSFVYAQIGNTTLGACTANCTTPGVILVGANFQPPSTTMTIAQLQITYSVGFTTQASNFQYNSNNWGVGFASPPGSAGSTQPAIYYGTSTKNNIKVTVNDTGFTNTSTTHSGTVVVTLDFTSASSQLTSDIASLIDANKLSLIPYYQDTTGTDSGSSGTELSCTTCQFLWQADIGALLNAPTISTTAADGAIAVNLTAPSNLSAVTPNAAGTALTGNDTRQSTTVSLTNSVSGYVLVYWLDQDATGTKTGCNTNPGGWQFYLNSVAIATSASPAQISCTYTPYDISFQTGGTTSSFGCNSNTAPPSPAILPFDGTVSSSTLTYDQISIPFNPTTNPNQLAQGSNGTPVGCYNVVYIPSSQNSWTKSDVNNGDIYGITAWALNYALSGTTLYPNYSLAHSNISYVTAVNLPLASKTKSPDLTLSTSDCFVVTAASGNPDSEAVFYWRILRDEYLTSMGITPFYYRHAKDWAGWLNKHPSLKPSLNFILETSGKYLYHTGRFIKKALKNLEEKLQKAKNYTVNTWEKSAGAEELPEQNETDTPNTPQFPSYEAYLIGNILFPTADKVYFQDFYSSQPTWGMTAGANYLFWLGDFGFSAGLQGRYLTNMHTSSVTQLGTQQSFTRNIYFSSIEAVGGIRYANLSSFPYIQPGIFIGVGVDRTREEAIVGSNQTTFDLVSKVKGVTVYSPVYEAGVNIDFSLLSLSKTSKADTGSFLNDVLFRCSASYNLNPSKALSTSGYLVGAGFSFLIN